VWRDSAAINKKGLTKRSEYLTNRAMPIRDPLRHKKSSECSDFVHSFSNTLQVALCVFPFCSADIERLIVGVDALGVLGEPAQSTCVAMLYKAGRRAHAVMGITEMWVDVWTEALCRRDFVSLSRLLRELGPAVEGRHPIVLAARQHIAHHCSDPGLSAAMTARALGLARRCLTSTLAGSDAGSYRHLLRQMRVDRGLAMLRTTDLSIKEVAFACGFRHPSEFSRACVVVTGWPPRECQRRLRKIVK
jgi:AraC-like DNA-binding protein